MSEGAPRGAVRTAEALLRVCGPEAVLFLVPADRPHTVEVYVEQDLTQVGTWRYNKVDGTGGGFLTSAQLGLEGDAPKGCLFLSRKRAEDFRASPAHSAMAGAPKPAPPMPDVHRMIQEQMRNIQNDPRGGGVKAHSPLTYFGTPVSGKWAEIARIAEKYQNRPPMVYTPGQEGLMIDKFLDPPSGPWIGPTKNPRK